MTEQELIDLRDSLVTLNSSLDTLDTRVVALEDLNVPKGAYFEQLTATFEESPDCCACTETTVPVDPSPCNCVNATDTVYIRHSSDGFSFGVLTVDGVNYNEFYELPADIRITYDQFSQEPTIIEDHYYVQITNTSAVARCVSFVGMSLDNFLGYNTVMEHVWNSNPTYVETVELNPTYRTLSFCLSPFNNGDVLPPEPPL